MPAQDGTDPRVAFGHQPPSVGIDDPGGWDRPDPRPNPLARCDDHTHDDAAALRSARLDEREAMVRHHEEVLTQHLYGVGLALRSCLGRTTPVEGRARVEETLDVLDEVLAQLIFEQPGRSDS